MLESDGIVLRKAALQRLIAKLSTRPKPLAAKGGGGRSLKEIADEAAREAERQAICETLRETRGNKSQAARALSTDYKTLHMKMKLLGIHAKHFGP